MNREEITAWLLNSDPAIRWQVMKDIQGAEESIYTQERQRLAEEGWCARLLGLQDENGLWNKSLYNGKHRFSDQIGSILKIEPISVRVKVNRKRHMQ